MCDPMEFIVYVCVSFAIFKYIYNTTVQCITQLLTLPLKNSFTSCCTFGMRVDPPISTISSIYFALTSPSVNTFSTGFRVEANKSCKTVFKQTIRCNLNMGQMFTVMNKTRSYMQSFPFKIYILTPIAPKNITQEAPTRSSILSLFMFRLFVKVAN